MALIRFIFSLSEAIYIQSSKVCIKLGLGSQLYNDIREFKEALLLFNLHYRSIFKESPFGRFFGKGLEFIMACDKIKNHIAPEQFHKG